MRVLSDAACACCALPADHLSRPAQDPHLHGVAAVQHGVMRVSPSAGVLRSQDKNVPRACRAFPWQFF